MTAVEAWVRDTAAALLAHQRRNLASKDSPEVEAVQFVVKALAEGGRPATAAVLESIDFHRAVTR